LQGKQNFNEGVNEMQILKKRTDRAKKEKVCNRPDLHIVETGLKKIAMVNPSVFTEVL
jgi:hypothetical protein